MTTTKISTPADRAAAAGREVRMSYRMASPSRSTATRALLVEQPPPNEDEQYLSIVWGMLRRPIACTKCGLPTRTPSYWSGDDPSPPICGKCFRISIWGV